MHLLCWVLTVTLLPYLVLATTSYDKDGDYIIGAILPLTKDSGSGKCTVVNPEGIAYAEAMKLALEKISSSTKYRSLISSSNIGYAIRDNCDDPIVERRVVYEFNRAALAYSDNITLPKPVDIVLSAFSLDSVNSLHLLNVESIPQISYAKDNAKLMQKTKNQKRAVQNLISVYPENTMALQVIIDVVNEFKLQYVHAIFSDDYQGQEASKLMKESLKSGATCNDHFVLTDASLDSIIEKIKSNPLIKVIVVHCSKDIEKKLYKGLINGSMGDRIIFTTQDWRTDEASLSAYIPLVNGLIYVRPDKDISKFEDHMKAVQRPFANSGWLKVLFESLGGDDSCLETKVRDSTTEKCFLAEDNVRVELAKISPSAVYVFESIYTIAEGLLKGKDVIETVKNLQFVIPFLGRNTLKFNEYNVADGTSYYLRNMQKGKSQSVYAGLWEKIPNRESLRLLKTSIQFKDNSKETPVSTCSAECPLGFYRKFIDMQIKCCWKCELCPNGTFSNVTNADKCMKPCKDCVAKPDKSGFVKYQLVQFHWFGPIGSFLIFLIVLACCFILFGLGVISQNSSHELIRLSGYNLLCLYLIGCLLLALAPIPLLVSPTTGSCNGFIAVMNIGLTVIFAVMMSRSSYVNGFYDENGDTVKGGLGKYPRLTIIMILILVQGIILIVVNTMYPPPTYHSDTDVYSVKYAECSNWASWGFWVAFSFNIALSLIGNFMSCSSTKMEEICEELKWLLITYLIFYLNGMVEIILIYRVKNQHLAVGQAVLCIIMSLSFYFFYVWPKVWYVMFRSTDGKIQQHLERLPQDEDHMTTAIHSSDAFRHHGVVQMRLKQDDENSSV